MDHLQLINYVDLREWASEGFFQGVPIFDFSGGGGETAVKFNFTNSERFSIKNQTGKYQISKPGEDFPLHPPFDAHTCDGQLVGEHSTRYIVLSGSNLKTFQENTELNQRQRGKR